jgi:hypothetical protein
MGFDNLSQSNSSGNQPDSLLQKAVGDLQAGQLNNQAFSQDINALYTRDQGTQGQFNADLMALNQQLETKNILPNMVLIGEDGQGDMIYDNPTNHQIGVVGTDNKQVDSGSEQDMLAKYGFTQANTGDQGGTGSGQADAQNVSQAQAQDQSSQASPQDQSAQAGPQDQSAQPGPQDQRAQPGPEDQSAQPGPQDQSTPSSDQTPPVSAAANAGQPETWGQHGRKYTPAPGQDAGYTHVVEAFQGADKPGDTMYRIASDSLDNQHNNDPSYQPSAQEVTAEIQSIAAYNADAGTIGQPPNYEIQVGETIKIPPKDWTAPSAQASDNPPSEQDTPAPSSSAAAQDAPAPSSSAVAQDTPAPSSPAAAQDAPAPSSSAAASDSSGPSYTQTSPNNPAAYNPDAGDSNYPGYAQAAVYNPATANMAPYGYANEAQYGYTPPEPPPPYGYANEAPYSYTQPGPPPNYGYANEAPYSYTQPGPPVPYGYANEAPYGYGPAAYREHSPQYYQPSEEAVVNPVGIVRDLARLFRR